MRLTFTDRVGLIVVDEVSMLSAGHLALLNTRLRAVYQNQLDFGGRSIMLAGDFLQLDVTAGTSLCRMMYQATTPCNLTDAKTLFGKVKVCFLTQQHRAASCLVHQANLTACRSLPSFYPFGTRYTAQEARAFCPLTPEIAAMITHELSQDDVEKDPEWLDEMTILVTNNFDKAALTRCAAQLYAKRNDELLFRWKRETKLELPIDLQRLVYDEDAQPGLFAYFVRGIPAQILDNNSGNVGWSVANGTPCKMHSLAWQEQAKNDIVAELIARARQSRTVEVNIPFPPDFVNVVLLEPGGGIRTGKGWPNDLNLESELATDASKERPHKKDVVIPIGLMGSSTKKPKVTLGAGVLETPHQVEYVPHAVDVALVMTVWKAQGSTLKRVVLNLEPIRKTAPSWGFEHLYVGMSRVTAARYLRCFPLTGQFRMSRLLNLRPSIFTTKWRLDHQFDEL